MIKNIQSGIVIAFLLVSAWYMRNEVFDSNAHAQFQGPGCAAGACNGKISVNSAGNVSVGTTTASTDSKLLVVASDTASTAYALRGQQPGGTSLFVFRNDNKAAIGTTVNSSYVLNIGGDTNVNGTITATNLSGTFSGTVAASNVTAGVFGAGNFGFPSSLGIATTTNASLPQVLSVYGSGYISSKLGIGVISPTYALEVNGQVKITGGTPGAGKVLTSDASGIATWETPATSTAVTPGFSSMTTYQTAGSDTFTVPAGVTKIMVEVWGGGGGGGGGSGGSGGGGGGAGGYAKGIFSVSAGQIYSITVGAFGDPDAAVTSDVQAGSGGSSSFVSPTSTTLLSATGGSGGFGSLSSSRNQGGSGGVGSGGSIALSGQGGEGGIVSTPSYGGTGGNAPFGGPGGNGAQGGGAYTRSPGTGIWPGGGGGGGGWPVSNPSCGLSGGSKQGCGGNGAVGGVIVWY